MVKALDVVNYTNGLIGKSIDEDGMYGSQCMDLTVHVMKRFFGWHPSGNAINLTSQAIPNGFTRMQVTSASEIKAGDVIIWGLGAFAAYGHTAIAIEGGNSNGTFVSIDQNWINPSLEIGSPAAQVVHNLNGVWGVIRPNYSNDGNVPGSGVYSGGSLTNAGNTISENNIRLVINAANQYNIKPSFLIAQMFIESHWGNPNVSVVGNVDNNWSGISEPFTVPSDLGINMSRGSARPSNEGGYYVHFTTMSDFFKAYAFLLSRRNGLYNVEGTDTIENYCKGLFRVGGANADYAASGYEHYLSMILPTYNSIKEQNPGKLEQIDSSGSGTNMENEGEEDMTEFAILYGTGVYYVCGTKMVPLTSSTQWSVLRSVYEQVQKHKTGKATPIKIMDWRNNQATFDAYAKICGLK